jgi:hypothetical protein
VHTIALIALLVPGSVVSARQQASSSSNGAAPGSNSGVVPRSSRNAPGTLRGHTAEGVPRPYTDYVVTVRDVQTGGVIANQPLDAEGNFAFEGLTPRKFVVVELRNVRRGGVVWTGGPYVLSADRAMNLAVSAGYGSVTAPWVLTAAAEVPTVVPLAIRSGSR